MSGHQIQTAATSRPGPAGGARGWWPMRDLPVVGWLLAAVAVTLVHPFAPAPRWLMIHLLLLGAAGHAILVWSRYFADTLLRGPKTGRPEQNRRLALFNLGVLAVATGIPGGWWPLTVVGATAVGIAVGWHAITLGRGLRGRFRSRFASTIHYYLLAGALLAVGAVLGTWLAHGLGDPAEIRVRVAHIAVNLLGWIGLTVLGTLVTLWPTMLRTRLPDGAERAAGLALPLLASGIAAVVAAAAGNRPLGTAGGLVLYVSGIGVLAAPMVRAARHKPPAHFSTWSVGAGMGWLVAGVTGVIGQIAVGRSWPAIDEAVAGWTPYLAVGFVAQVLLGALSYLIPVVLGGGPTAVRAANRAIDAGGALRVSVANGGLVVCVLPVPSLVRVVASVATLGALAAFVPILLRALRVHRRTRAGESGDPLPRPAGQNTGLAVTGLAVIVLSVAVGGSFDPAALTGPARSAAAGVPPTGHTVRVSVTAAEMRFTPDRIEVTAGDRLVITVANTDDSDVHDLVLETGHDSGRLVPGERGVIDVGVVGRDLDGWCSVVGHRQMGMVLTIVAEGAPEATAATSGDRDSTGHATSHPVDHGSEHPGEDFVARDATLPPLTPRRVHRITFRVTEIDREVAPGVTQELWTFNGTSPGPILHGRVGDRFVVRLVNDGTIGHSVDFHAGMRAPDRVMRTLAPGESLIYRFRADRAGIWMYHCSTMPMSAHIANGLFGAVVIEPPDLPAVDRSFVLVQSEHYYGAEGGTVDMDKVLAETPDAVVFNGYANQYDAEPLRVRSGDRIRIWVLDAGPSRSSSFHVVGGQFDTVYREGAWLLGGPDGPAPVGGAQVLTLGAAEGGFVELSLAEPGHYPFVSHVMVDAERGAHGVLRVVPTTVRR